MYFDEWPVRRRNRSGRIDPAIAAISSFLPFAPFSRWGAIADSARVADISAPDSVIALLGSGVACFSGYTGDGCLYSGLDRSTEALGSGTPVASIWNWNSNSSSFLSQANLALRANTSSDGLIAASGKMMPLTISSQVSGYTATERICCFRTTANGRHEFTNGAGCFPFTDGFVYERWGAIASPGFSPPFSLITAGHFLLNTFHSGTSRSVQFNNSTPNTSTSSVSMSSAYALGTTFSGSQAITCRFFWMRNSALDSTDRLRLRRFVNHYCGIGLTI